MSMKRQHKEFGSLCFYPYNKQNMNKLKVSDFFLSPISSSKANTTPKLGAARSSDSHS